MTVIDLPPTLDLVPVVTGDPEGVDDIARSLRDASAVFDDLDSTASANVAPSGWEGEAAECYGARVREVAADAGTTSLTLRAAALAFDTYADELTSIRTERERLVDDRYAYRAALVDLRQDIEATGGHTPATQEQIAEFQSRASDLRTWYATHVADVEAMLARVTANDEALRSVLTSYATMADARVNTAGGDPADALMQRPGAPGTGGTAEDTAAWWNGLTEAEQAAVIAAYPDVIGAADGLPTVARDEANRLMLDNDLTALGQAEANGTITYEQQRILDNARAAQRGLDEAASTVDPITGETLPAFLHLYQPDAFDYDGRVAIAVGNPDTADNVTTLVPGMTTTAQDAAGYAEDAGNMVQSARLSGAGSTAAIAWIGYDAPSDWDTGSVLFEGKATEGGELLANHVAGLQAARGDNPPHMTVVGHSYGSTTMAHAATDHGMGSIVDDLVFLGSPGAGSAEHASDLGPAQVWAGNASRDPVARLADDGWVNGGTFFGAGMGRDVAEDTFGAIRFQAEDVDRNAWQDDGFITSMHSHSSYWEPGSESLYNLGLIVGGNDAAVVQAGHTYDPWYAGVQDHEYDRTPNTYPDRVAAEGDG